MDTAPEAPLVVATAHQVRQRPATAAADISFGGLRVGALTVGMAALGVVAWHLQTRGGVQTTSGTLLGLALIPTFAVAEMFAIELPTLRGAHRHSLRELPALVGLAFLSPTLYIVAFVLGGGIGLWLRAQRGTKLAFGLASFLVEASLGMLAYRALLGDGDALGPRGWAAAFVAILVMHLAALAATTAATSLTEGRLDREALNDAARFGIPAAMVNTCLALLCLVLAVQEPSALPLLGLALVVLAVAYRGYVALARGYAQLRLLHRFVEAGARAVDIDDGVETLLRNSCELLGAERAEFVVLPVARRVGSRTTIDADGVVTRVAFSGPERVRDAWWAPASLGEAVLRPYDSMHLDLSTEPPPTLRDGLAIPLQRDGQVEVVLLVMDRRSEPTFTARDQRMLETLAGHAAVALDTARLVERLEAVATQRMYEARHDVLTGLPNRRAFEEAIGAARGQSGAVLLIDLDDFKDINDTLGHMAGDALLCEIGERVQFASGGTVARLGGDEFAVILTGVREEEARQHARELLAVISRPVTLDDVSLLVSASVGIALVPDHGNTTSELLQHADVAMYVAKDAGSRVEVYRVDDGELSERRLVLAADLEAAIERRQFEVYYQPQADARSGRVAAFEALLRWSHPTYGNVPPPEVVALAERTGLLRRLTNGVLAEALRQRAAWSDLGHHVNVSVNVTPTDLCDSGLPGTVQDLLTSTGTPADALTLEITETGMMSDPARCGAVLDIMSGQGVRLAVDDFGTGHSSLAYLERLPVNELKIDRSFVQRLEREVADTKVVRATVALAHDLGLCVVAEGVESQIAWARVIDLGCELVQGYALARPMPSADATTWLDASRVARAG